MNKKCILAFLCVGSGVLVALSGCEQSPKFQPGREPGKRSEWSTTARFSSSPRTWWYLNSYMTNSRDYPGYGVASYYRPSLSEDSHQYSDETLFVDSLRLCREAFADSYAGGYIEPWSRSDGGKGTPGLRFVVIFMSNYEDEKGRHVGAVFPASKVFDAEVDLLNLLQSAELKYGTLREDDGKTYPIIEDHMDANSD